jgi:hypothetical protein
LVHDVVHSLVSVQTLAHGGGAGGLQSPKPPQVVGVPVPSAHAVLHSAVLEQMPEHGGRLLQGFPASPQFVMVPAGFSHGSVHATPGKQTASHKGHSQRVGWPSESQRSWQPGPQLEPQL